MPNNGSSAASATEKSSPQEGEDDRVLVQFKAGEKEDPKEWGSLYKAFLVAQLSLLAMTGSIGSSIIAPSEQQLADEFHTNLELTVLTVALFVLGFAFGPLLWAPISEVHGRKWSMLPAVFVLGILSIGSARSTNEASLYITRFLGGLFGSAPISNVSAALADFYEPRTRGVPMTFLAVATVGGAVIGPIIGAAITVNRHLGWRWTEYIEAIIAFATVAFDSMFLPETYPPVLLGRKARRMKAIDRRYFHPHEEEKISPRNIVNKYLSRPLRRMLFTEPMVTAIALYASFIYGLLYLTLELFPILFYEQRHWSLFISTLPFFGLFVGVLFAILINLANQPRYARAVQKNSGRAVPEARLPPMFIGSVCFSVGLFWFGWTAAPEHPWPLPVVAAGFIGAGFNITFQQCLNFLVDTYGPYAASAASANTFLRSLLACGLPLAARPMFGNLGVGPGASILGGLSCLALPMPFVFLRYSSNLRKMSKFAPVPRD